MPSLFEYLGAISSGDKIDLEVDNPFAAYVPFQINNGLAQNIDTVLLANEMNKNPWLSKEMQYRFLAGIVTKKKRYGKWAKLEELADQADIDTVSTFYQVNKERAAEYLKLIPPNELEYMRMKNGTGGCDVQTKAKSLPKTKKAKK